MAFNERNSVEHYIIHQISGLNLNIAGVRQKGGGKERGGMWQRLNLPVENRSGRITFQVPDSSVEVAIALNLCLF